MKIKGGYLSGTISGGYLPFCVAQTIFPLCVSSGSVSPDDSLDCSQAECFFMIKVQKKVR